MDYSLKVFSNYLFEAREDKELTEALKETMNESSKVAIKFVKEKYLKEADEAKAGRKAVSWETLLKRDAEKVISRKVKLEGDLAKGSFNPEEAIELALDIVSIDTSLPVTEEDKEFLTQEIKKVDAETDEVRKKRIAKILGFRAISIINTAAKKLEAEGKSTRTITRKDNTVIVRDLKGKNADSFTLREVLKSVKEAGTIATAELGSVDSNTNTETKAKIYAGILAKEFINSQYEGQKKENQFVEEYKKYMASRSKIERVVDDNKKETDDWQKLSILTNLYDIYEYSKGKSKLSLEQIRSAIKRFKETSVEGLKIASEYLSKKAN